MDRYLETYREMISLRGLTGHTLKGYSTYIRAYLDYSAALPPQASGGCLLAGDAGFYPLAPEGAFPG